MELQILSKTSLCCTENPSKNAKILRCTFHPPASLPLSLREVSIAPQRRALPPPPRLHLQKKASLFSAHLWAVGAVARLAVASAHPPASAAPALSPTRMAAAPTEDVPAFAETPQSAEERLKSTLSVPFPRPISRRLPRTLSLVTVAPLVFAATTLQPEKTRALSAAPRQLVAAPVSSPPSLQNLDAPEVAKEPPLTEAVLVVDSVASPLAVFVAAPQRRRLAPQTCSVAAVVAAVAVAASAPLPITSPFLPPLSYPPLLSSSSPRLRL
mmetsp:Transcript_671/g.2400  ORF Transcript_671/g.2400 Transcript_671/m.2400 type:complete len:269 (+) Transcript_671:1455-2261(+)